MLSFFRKNKEPELPAPTDFSFLGVDLHSHLIPLIDDGSDDLEESLEMVRAFKDKGYRKLITTPHVHGEFYDNTIEGINVHFDKLKRFINDNRLNIDLQVAAEYFLDNHFLTEVLPHGLIPFGDNYVLVEVSMAGWPRNFDEIIFEIQSKGYKPILAHIERYGFEQDPDVFLRLKEKGVLMQMNLLAIHGYYNRSIRLSAEDYMKHNIYDFCASDAHHIRHLQTMDRIAKEEPAIMQKLEAYGFKNNRLLS